MEHKYLVADEPVDDAADDGENEGGKGGCPESANGHPWHNERSDLEHESVDHEGKQAKGEYVKWQGENGENWFDDGIDNGQYNSTKHKRGDGVKIKSLYELGSEIQSQAVGQKMNNE